MRDTRGICLKAAFALQHLFWSGFVQAGGSLIGLVCVRLIIGAASHVFGYLMPRLRCDRRARASWRMVFILSSLIVWVLFTPQVPCVVGVVLVVAVVVAGAVFVFYLFFDAVDDKTPASP